MTTTRTPQEAKEEVRNAIDIAQVIGERVPLRRAGRTWKGLCPFHAEKTPSFTVNPERQIWHCFGCNKGGDVFAFLMEIDKSTFPEALQVLAERAGIDLPRSEATAGDKQRDRLYQATALASDFFQASFHSEAGANARQLDDAREHQPGRRQQHDGECHLRHDQCRSRARRPVRRRGPAGCLQRIADVIVRAVRRDHGAEDQAERRRENRGEKSHAGVDVDCNGRRERVGEKRQQPA